MTDAVGPRVPITTTPLNAETPLPALWDRITPAQSFYVRSHFAAPVADPSAWSVEVGGALERKRRFTLPDLYALPRVSHEVTLECAGNGRRRMDPVPPGTPWDLGAVSTAAFGGVALRSLLLPLGIDADAVEVLFRGADSGDDPTPYARSLPLDVALDPDTLVAWEMNRGSLPPEHGFPLRLVVPGWYAMASVKWLVGIEVITRPFSGRFQTDDYVYLGEAGVADGTPVTRMRVRAVITSPAADQVLSRRTVEVTGRAWSGYGPVVAVEFSADAGHSWQPTALEPQVSFAAQRWTAQWTPDRSGAHMLLVRARDAAGNRQPLEPRWNRLGYGNNVCHRITVQVR